MRIAHSGLATTNTAAIMAEELHIWQRAETALTFLDEIRGGIPLADVQIDVMVRLARHCVPHARRLLDLGCGDGILGRTLMQRMPALEGTFVDFSETMLEQARQRIDAQRAVCRAADFRRPDWTAVVIDRGPFDLIVSGFAIHHLDDDRKQALYAELFALAAPGGLMLNLEHVASESPAAHQAFYELFIDSLWAEHRRRGGEKSRAQIAEAFLNRPSRAADQLAPVEEQCRWLRQIGFVEVGCWLKIFELALFGGRKPEAAQAS